MDSGDSALLSESGGADSGDGTHVPLTHTDADVRAQIAEWRADFDRALVLLEDIAKHAAPGDTRVTDLIDCFEAMDKEGKREVDVILELLGAPLGSLAEDKKLFEQRLRELEDEEERSGHSELFDSLRKSLNSADDSREMVLVEKQLYLSKDPVTKKDIQNPVRNAVCGHVYDRDSVEAFIQDCKKRRMLCQCPIPSCPNKKKLSMDDMVPFPEFFNQIADSGE